MNYSLLSGYNLPPTDADGKVGPDIVFIVRQAMVKIVYSKQFLKLLHILRFQKGSVISRYGAY